MREEVPNIGSSKHDSIARGFSHVAYVIDASTLDIASFSLYSTPSVNGVALFMSPYIHSTLGYNTFVPHSLGVGISVRTLGLIVKIIGQLPITLQMDHELVPVKGLKLHGNYV